VRSSGSALGAVGGGPAGARAVRAGAPGGSGPAAAPAIGGGTAGEGQTDAGKSRTYAAHQHGNQCGPEKNVENGDGENNRNYRSKGAPKRNFFRRLGNAEESVLVGESF